MDHDDAAPDAVGHERAGEPAEDPVAAEARALLAEIEADLAAVSAALDRLEAGGYGTCEICGAPIADEALAADPGASRCSAHR